MAGQIIHAKAPMAKRTWVVDTIVEATALHREILAHCQRLHSRPFEILPEPNRNMLMRCEWDTVAERLWAIGHAFHQLSFTWTGEQWPSQWYSMRGKCLSEYKCSLGDIVCIHGAMIGKRQRIGVGELLSIGREPGPRRKYDEDGGPVRAYEQYELKLLDGTIIPWTDASYSYVPSVRYIKMVRDIYSKPLFGR